MQVEFELTPEEWRHAAEVSRREMLARRGNPYRLLGYVGYAACILGAFLLALRPEAGRWIGPVGLIGVGLFIPIRLGHIAMDQMAAAAKTADRLQQPIRWEFGEERVCIAERLFHWRHFTRWTETRNVFLLWVSTEQCHVIPKRSFGSAEAIAPFRQLLEEKITPPVRGFPVQPAK